MATKASWAKLTVNIFLSDLPPLFQDAIIITRQLGLRYLWIDSLCIIQDSLRDWETEAAKMASIYQNSYVTISATDASNGSAKCLQIGEKRSRFHTKTQQRRNLRCGQGCIQTIIQTPTAIRQSLQAH